ncbi:chymotrypsin inhibitor-like [Nasonia vitripennis]|uniref:TIL domain-containing protein n=1 Tax=Nasonia vitripennis TaxID=7425 RepID=A0A7M7QMH9_NASVI|nr:chymotrypsin inhibitor-like [Nasonia vitripennis]XP_008215341.1 chymotrypsin inhibitor-like [Nasonia vitripennis]XP_031776621.1 chymotrypsin inhibitor-like [Nasonia vitripennis]XP_032451907.1 chymotrypsin inhibitor-like [Nasonia vitripennis]XP_032451908.1 chymotrypsin inhibitor-like [Nasonia vitripennis]
MSKLVVLCLLVLCISASLIDVDAESHHYCPKPNQEWTTCGSACPPICDDKEPKMCTLQCVIGCQCKRGYLLNSDGKCVKPEDC